MELESLIKSNKAATDKRMEAMAAHYTMELNAVRSTMKKNRAHATHMLAKKTAALYDAIGKGEKDQMKTNGALKAQTRSAELDIANALREAKDDFSQRIGSLSKTVADNDKKFEGKMDKLTGIVRANAAKNAAGRADLKKMMDANKSELKAAVSAAVTKGENRMKQAENKLTAMNKKTKAALSMKIATEISKLEKRANDQIEGLHLQSKEARAEMKKELLFAVRSMAKEAKTNLDDAADELAGTFEKTEAAEAAAAAKSAAGRAAIAASIKQAKANAEEELEDAVATMARSLTALKMETAKKNKKIKDAQMGMLKGKVASQKAGAKAAIGKANAASAAGFAAASKKVEAALKAAQAKTDQRFGKLNADMAEQRASIDKSLAGSIDTINDSIAKQAALADSRFSKTVTDIKAARKEASDQVKLARQSFATDLAAATAEIKMMETKYVGEITKVAGVVMTHKAAQTKVNRKVDAELKRINKVMNHRRSDSARARGKLRAILDENKRAAAEEVKALDGLFKSKLSKIRSKAASDAIEAKQDLTEATAEMSEALEVAQREQLYANQVSAQKINKYSADAEAKIAAAKEDFSDQLHTLTNVVAANHKQVEKGMEVLTGVIRDYKAAGKAERALLRKQNAAMDAD